MFWGLIMEPNKRYTQTVEKSFHVSMAALDVASADDNVVQVTVWYDGTNYLLCSLKNGTIVQVPLDLHFQEGTKIAFTCNGRSSVHLTGYLIPEDDVDLGDELEEEEEEEEEEKVPQLVDKQSKRKALELPKGGKKVKRVKHEPESSDNDDLELDGTNDEDEEDEGDESLLNDEDDSDEEEDEEDDEDDDDDEEDDDDDDDDDKDDEKVQMKPSKQEEKKNKQAQQQQQQQQQQKKKQDKQKVVVNGRNVKEDQQSNKHQQQQKKKGEQQQQQQNAQNEQKKRVIQGGVQIKDLQIGNGAPAKSGKFVSVYYVGRLQNGKKFDATTQGDGFKFRLGKGEVIKGWDVGISGMKVGGKRQITIPPAMAYGAKGSPPAIPGNSTLVFEVELKNVH